VARKRRSKEPEEKLPVPAHEPDWLTLGQAAKYLGMAQSTIRKWSDQKRLPAFYTPGGHRRYRRSDLDQFLERGGVFTPRRAEGRRLILIVDDDDRLREFVRVNLENEGYAVREAANATEGLAVLEDEPPDLILLDVMMPQVDGWEMLRRVQEQHGVGAIPVIMFSGKVDEDGLKRATSRGAQGFIGKPFDPQQLIDSTKQLVPT
jgi:excisionase family DNA binding protein